MKKNYCIIGTGRQGRAAAYDLLKFAPVNQLLLLDNNQDNYYSYLDTDYLLSSIVYNDKIITKDINLRIFDYLYFLLLIVSLYVIDLLVRRKLYLL